MKTRWSMAAMLFLGGFLLGLVANHFTRPQEDDQNLTSSAPVQGKTYEGALLEQKREELRQAIDELVKREGNTASVLNRREQVFKSMFDDLESVHGSARYNIRIFRFFDAYRRKHLGSDTRARVLEIGPGINLGTGLLFSMAGAQKYYGLDIYKDPDLFGAPQYESIVDLMTAIAPGDIRIPPKQIMTIAAGQVTFEKNKVEYLYPHQSYDIPLSENSIDFIFSNATLEHVADPLKTIQSFRRVLSREGITVHRIDLRDHADFEKPLEFLKIDPLTWKDRHKDPSEAHHYKNRWRASDFKAAFENNGFQILKMEPTHRHEVTDEMRRSLHPDFQHYSLDDLSITGILVVAKRR